VSKYLKGSLYDKFLINVGSIQECQESDVAGALEKAFLDVDTEVMSVPKMKQQGSTACCVVIQETSDNSCAFITSNVGDSRAVLARQGVAIELTTDHKPNSPDERGRIEGLGGRVTWHGQRKADGSPWEETGVYRVNANLALSRAIGILSFVKLTACSHVSVWLAGCLLIMVGANTGDKYARPFVISTPDIVVTPGTGKEDFVIGISLRACFLTFTFIDF
jgi:serine/threonine protein phosphatase PrpC